MKKFLFTLFSLLFILVFTSTVTAHAADVSGDELDSVIEEQILNYISTLPSKDDGAKQLTNHAFKGNGSDYIMDENSAFTATILNSELYQESIIHATQTALRSMIFNNTSQLYMRGGVYWYDDDKRYTNTGYATDNEFDGNLSAPPVYAHNYSYTGATNTYDDQMVLLVGTGFSRFSFKRTAVNAEELTYNVTYRIYDDFDFVGASYGDKDYLSKLLTLLGGMLDFGTSLEPFRWDTSVNFNITVPNLCPHESSDYLWEFDGSSDLTNISDESHRSNSLTKYLGTTENGVFSSTIYKMENPVHLYHNLPWTIEWKSTGYGHVVLSEDQWIDSGVPYMTLHSTSVLFGECFLADEQSEEYTYSHYGADFGNAGYQSSDTHVYRLTNHVNPNGTNMVYLFVDGKEIGPMTQHYLGGNPQNSSSNWISGRDFTFNYIGNSGYTLHNVSLEYLKVYENGTDSQKHSFIHTSIVEPTCTAQGLTTKTCLHCGVTLSETITAALGHTVTTVDGYDATYTKEGLTTGTVCTACNETLSGCQAIPKLEIPFTDLAEQSYYYESVLWALENKITTGTTQTTFGPLETCTRAQVVTFLWRANGSPAVEAENPFTDTNPNAFYYQAMLWAIENGITNGTGETTFSPNDTCTRGQIVTFLWRANGSPTVEAENPFTDTNPNAFYHQAMLWAVSNQITNGTSETAFSPAAECKRAEVVTFLHRAIK